MRTVCADSFLLVRQARVSGVVEKGRFPSPVDAPILCALLQRTSYTSRPSCSARPPFSSSNYFPTGAKALRYSTANRAKECFKALGANLPPHHRNALSGRGSTGAAAVAILTPRNKEKASGPSMATGRRPFRVGRGFGACGPKKGKNTRLPFRGRHASCVSAAAGTIDHGLIHRNAPGSDG